MQGREIIKGHVEGRVTEQTQHTGHDSSDAGSDILTASTTGVHASALHCRREGQHSQAL
jgi:hypothetical protein